MDREEAISVIENEIQIDVRLCTDDQVDRFQTALYMAISALRADHNGDAADMMANADLLARAEAAEARAEKAEKKLEAAVKELNGVQSSVDDLAEFIDEQIHPLVPYGFYTDLRENADSISMWQYEKEWRGQKEE